MRVISSIEEINSFSSEYRRQHPEKKIGLVPTMGFIHEGHLSLIRKARANSDHIVVSIFVNPIQFNQKEDFEKYPRDISRDQELLKKEGVDTLFMPSAQDVFPKTDQSPNQKPLIQLSIPRLQKNLCAPTRPGHFEGVLLIVYYLFLWVRPHIAVFGLKDYQQYLCVKTMSEELWLGVHVIGSESIRDEDSLVLSSRNARLSPKGRKDALILYKTLKLSQEEWKGGANIRELRQLLRRSLQGQRVDYADFYDPDTLEILDHSMKPTKALLAMAVWFEDVRLLDNLILDK